MPIIIYEAKKLFRDRVSQRKVTTQNCFKTNFRTIVLQHFSAVKLKWIVVNCNGEEEKTRHHIQERQTITVLAETYTFLDPTM